MTPTTLEQLCERITSGGTPSRSKKEFFDGSVPWFKSAELTGWYIDRSGESITEDAVAASGAKLLPSNTVLLAMYGDGRTIGSSAILRQPATCNQACCALIPDGRRCEPRFLLYLVSHHRKAIVSLALGGAQRNLSAKIIKSFPVRVPTLAAQRRIADVLSAYDDLIENNTRRIQVLEEMARSLYREWFVEFRFPGHGKARFLGQGEDRIPSEWTVGTLGGAATFISRGVSPKYAEDGAEVVVNQKCIRDQRISLEPARQHQTKVPPNKYIRAFDVLINSTGVGTLGRVAQVLRDLEACTVDTHVTIVRPNSAIAPHYWGQTLMAKESYFEAQGAGATGQTELARTRIAETSILLPPRELQRRFDKMVEPWLESAEVLLTKQRVLRTTRDLLLPRLISGEVSVREVAR